MIKKYLNIIKPGVVFGNIVSFIGGFLLASKGDINYVTLLYALIAMTMILISSCLFNNIIDFDIDQKMERTKSRITAKRSISFKIIFIYAIFLCILSFFLFYLFINLLTMELSIIGFVIYVIVYTLYIKRKSIHSTIIGSFAGALPPVIGYCSVSNKFDLCSLIIMTIFCLWQMPHFYFISIMYYKDYKTALIPILPIKKGIYITKHYINFYIVCFIVATSLLTFSGYTGYKYLIITTIINLLWLYVSLSGYKKSCVNKIWAKQSFNLSVYSIMLISIMMSIDCTILSSSN